MLLPPGVRFIASNVLLPVAFLLLARRIVNTTFGLAISSSTFVSYSLAGLCVIGVGHAIATSVRQYIQARSMGARPVPQVTSKWPGNMDFLWRLVQEPKIAYLGDTFAGPIPRLGPVYNVELLWETHIFTVCPQHIQIILAGDFNNYVKGDRFRGVMNTVLGDGVFNSDGELWSLHRSMTRPYFARDRVRHFDIFDRHADKTIELIKKRMNEGYAVDFQDVISRFTMDAATEFLFGTCVNSLANALPYPHGVSSDVSAVPSQKSNDFSAAFHEAMLQITFREWVGWIWPLFEMFEDRTAAPMKIVNSFVEPIIRNAVEKKKRNDGTKVAEFEGALDDDNDTLLDELLNSITDPKLLRDETLNILFAGRETTMHTITIAIYFLAIHPNVMARLREEVLDVVGPSARPSYDDIKGMKYLRAVLNETMRLYPSVPFNLRETVKATTWPSMDPNDDRPLYIPAGVKVPYSVMIMQRRKDLWGPDADEFDPHRFLDERVQRIVSNPFQFLPFNGGPRICLGQQFAYNEMSFVIIRLLQQFSSISLDVEACPPEARVPPEWSGAPGRKGIERVRPQTHLTMYTMGGLWVKMNQA
ncbi:cytochrome P450 [Favolaschia claudopus]|uniref:Cytochrome P450 n=1 Tax=Favolaschia claudopus TaxID=2862362 RepID=A0AAW0C078_9AGAR